MALDVTIYTLEDADGHPAMDGVYALPPALVSTAWTYDELVSHAQLNRLRVIENSYEFEDSGLAEDFTPETEEDPQ